MAKNPFHPIFPRGVPKFHSSKMDSVDVNGINKIVRSIRDLQHIQVYHDDLYGGHKADDYLRRDGTLPMLGDLDMGGFEIHNVVAVEGPNLAVAATAGNLTLSGNVVQLLATLDLNTNNITNTGNVSPHAAGHQLGSAALYYGSGYIATAFHNNIYELTPGGNINMGDDVSMGGNDIINCNDIMPIVDGAGYIGDDPSGGGFAFGAAYIYNISVNSLGPIPPATSISMGGDIAMGAHNITLGVGQTVDGVDVSSIATTYLLLAGGTMAGNINMGSNDLTFVDDIVMIDGGTIGQAAGPLLTFDDTADELELTGGFMSVTLSEDARIDLKNLTGGAGDYSRIRFYDAVLGARVIAANTNNLLLVENNLTDETGTNTWTNAGASPYSSVIKYQGAYSAGQFTLNTHCIHSTAAVAAAIKTIEFYLYTPTGHSTTNQYVWSSSSGRGMSYLGGSGGFGIFNGGWAGWYIPPDDVWVHYAITFDGVNMTLYSTDTSTWVTTQRAQVACAVYETGATHHFGNHSGHTTPCTFYMDEIRLSTVVRATFPTTDTFVTTYQVRSWLGWDEQNDRAVWDTDDKACRIDCGTGILSLVAASVDVGSVKITSLANGAAATDAVNYGQVVLQTLADAKGDLIGASADNTWTRLAVGTNGQVLSALSTEVTGLKWVTATRLVSYEFNQIGVLTTGLNKDGGRPMVAGTIKRISLFRRLNGTGGTTTIDVNKNGASLFDVATKPAVTAVAGDNVVVTVTTFDAGENVIALNDYLTVDIDATETGGGGGAPQDLSVVVFVEPS